LQKLILGDTVLSPKNESNVKNETLKRKKPTDMNLNIKCDDFDHRFSLPKKSAEKSLSPPPHTSQTTRKQGDSLAKKR